MAITFDLIKPNVRLTGVQIGQIITVSHDETHGENAINLIFKGGRIHFGGRVVFGDDFAGISPVGQASAFTNQADPSDSLARILRSLSKIRPYPKHLGEIYTEVPLSGGRKPYCRRYKLDFVDNGLPGLQRDNSA